MRRTIIVIHPGAMGDVILSLASIRAIRLAFSAYDVGFIAQAEVGRLLVACGEVQKLFPIESQALIGLLSDGLALRPDLQAWLQTCDLAIAWMADRDEQLRETLHKVGVRQVIVRSPMSSASRAVHQEDRFLETMKDIATGAPNGEKLVFPSAARASAEVILERKGIMSGHRRLVLFHPGSGSHHKCGNPVLFANAIAHCQNMDTIPIIIGGPADDQTVASLRDTCGKKPVVIQHESLLSITGLLAHAAIFVGYDSGLSHLAARLHVPTIVVFGPTDPRRWAPRGSNVTVLTGEACRCIGWEAVRSCHEKPCLRVSSEKLIAACDRALTSPDMPAIPVSDRLVMSRDLC